MKVCLDPGHGGKDRANRGPTGYVEADGTLDIALRVRSILKKKGIDPIMTRDKDITVSLAGRTLISNKGGAGILVSIHTNAGPRGAGGIETYYSAFSSRGKVLAREIQKHLAPLGLEDRGTKTRLGNSGRDYYHMIRTPRAISVIVEVGFHTNPQEEQLLKTSGFRQRAAEGIAAGIVSFLFLSHTL
jgi:N-acetylmuramoyl-L-alanine amidase